MWHAIVRACMCVCAAAERGGCDLRSLEQEGARLNCVACIRVHVCAARLQEGRVPRSLDARAVAAGVDQPHEPGRQGGGRGSAGGAHLCHWCSQTR